MPFAQNEGCNINYAVEGEGDVILLVPGLGGSIKQMARISELLSQSHRVVTVDPRGAGESDKPDQAYNGKMLAQDMASVLEAAGVQSASIVGISFGGMIAQELALLYPEKVESLVLASSYAVSDAWTDRMWLVREQLIKKLGMEAHFSLALMFLFSPRDFRNNPDAITALEEAFGKGPADPTGYIRQLEYCRDHDAMKRLKEIEAPALVVTGAEDILASTLQGQELAAAIRNARYLEIPEASHLFMIQRPEPFVEIIQNFLNTNKAVRG